MRHYFAAAGRLTVTSRRNAPGSPAGDPESCGRGAICRCVHFTFFPLQHRYPECSLSAKYCWLCILFFGCCAPCALVLGLASGVHFASPLPILGEAPRGGLAVCILRRHPGSGAGTPCAYVSARQWTEGTICGGSREKISSPAVTTSHLIILL